MHRCLALAKRKHCTNCCVEFGHCTSFELETALVELETALVELVAVRFQVEILPALEEYLTDCGRTNLMQVEQFLEYLGGIEDQACD